MLSKKRQIVQNWTFRRVFLKYPCFEIIISINEDNLQNFLRTFGKDNLLIYKVRELIFKYDLIKEQDDDAFRTSLLESTTRKTIKVPNFHCKSFVIDKDE